MKQLHHKIGYLAILYIVSISCISTKARAQEENHSGQQNFSARYNYVYNANELIKKYLEEAIPEKNEDYTERLPVFIDLPVDNKVMDQVIKKANAVITDKGRSDYLDQAYLLLAKAYSYKRDDLTAIGDLDFLITSYSSSSSLLPALALKSKCLYHLGDREGAKDAALQFIQTWNKSDRLEANAYAALAQLYLSSNNIKKATSYLQEAIKTTRNPMDRGRWTYLYAQLQEEQLNFTDAEQNYRRIKNSDVSDELRLSATLKAIRLDGLLSGKGDPSQALLKLLKNENYADDRDQIYFNLGETKMKEQSFPEAEKYYQKALQTKIKSTMITSLSYQNIAKINLYYLANYSKAKLYYDSACKAITYTNRPYKTALKKLKNLRYISEIQDSLPKADEPKAIDIYYQTGTLYLQEVPDTLQAKKIYQLMLDKYPGNKYTAHIRYALRQINKIENSDIIPQGKYTGSLHGKPTEEEQLAIFHQALTELTEELKAHSLSPVEQQITTALAQSFPSTKLLAVSLPTGSPQPNHPLLPLLTLTGIPVNQARKPPEYATHKNIFNTTISSTYYFLIRIEDPNVNLSPTRFGIGEFDRSQYADSQLKHRLIDFDSCQVICVGIFQNIENAQTYARQINPSLHNIIKSNARYNTAIITKENLSLLTTDQVLDQYLEWDAARLK